MWTWKTAKRLVVFIVGMTVVLFGVALIVLPGPAFVVIPVGLAILATEFVWAQRLLKKMKDKAMGAANSLGLTNRSPATPNAKKKDEPEAGGRDSAPQ